MRLLLMLELDNSVESREQGNAAIVRDFMYNQRQELLPKEGCSKEHFGYLACSKPAFNGYGCCWGKSPVGKSAFSRGGSWADTY
ncbi:hypothetical protein E2C01_068751 [Portunus trituberculatus]|uniref:Uncharacterized protein n=1 Tax=Portunus trituberculatus TaxID=210409 RepID=A0A5B7HWR9_PORTR|nr:hypothetical protein [Portunus trituberculatus]